MSTDWRTATPDSEPAEWPTPGSAEPAEGDPKQRAAKDKLRLDCVPPTLLVGAAMAYEHGAYVKGYGPFNWRKSGVNLSTYYGAAMRHLAAFWDGENVDPESGISHLAHAIASIGIMLDAQALLQERDDRPSVQGPTGDMLRRWAEVPRDE